MKKSERPVTIVLSDKNQSVLDHCEKLLANEWSMWVIGHGSSEAEVLEVVQRTQPGVIMLGLDLVNDRKMGLIQLLLTKSPGSRLLLLADNDQYGVSDALASGACGVLMYSDMDTWLVKAIQKVSEGEPWISRKLAYQVVEHLRTLSCQVAANP